MCPRWLFILTKFSWKWTKRRGAEEQVLEPEIFPYLGFRGQNRVPIRWHSATPRIFSLISLHTPSLRASNKQRWLVKRDTTISHIMQCIAGRTWGCILTVAIIAIKLAGREGQISRRRTRFNSITDQTGDNKDKENSDWTDFNRPLTHSGDWVRWWSA